VQETPFEPNFKRPKQMLCVAGWILAFSGSASLITVMQPTDLRHDHDGSHIRRLNRSWLRCVCP
jgi:hypothetical protein